uniref:Uncharacterized protein n=1 Tax=Physcomitrium patens TaxID=3218 RepID=A0A2K1IRI4_PHYPA|nr:hypothetical protein PHYPA_026016 [Physcomitrium patens]
MNSMSNSIKVVHGKLLEANPESSHNNDMVMFNTLIKPYGLRHFPSQYLAHSRVGQHNIFFDKLLLFISVVGVMAMRKNSNIDTIQNLAKESTFYNRQ